MYMSPYTFGSESFIQPHHKDDSPLSLLGSGRSRIYEMLGHQLTTFCETQVLWIV